jgi:hypothetical protein
MTTYSYRFWNGGELLFLGGINPIVLYESHEENRLLAT